MIQKVNKYLFAFFLLVPLCVASAQESLTLSVSPTLFDMSAEPGQSWKSNLRVVNVNPFDLTVYVQVVNFAPKGEGGDGRFIPIIDGSEDKATLAEWFTITNEAVTIPREQTGEIPFTVTVPNDASPGGHFAAILVGTKPIKSDDGQAKLQTAQMVTSLFFARVAGDIIESGNIREFATTEIFLDSPEVKFELRFENKGNVHLQPQGEIKISNMWGQERGIIPINQYTNFGNVLPESIRKFVISWKGEWSVSDIGRYTAIATLGYGAESKQFTSAETSFWVIPIKLLLSVLLGLGLFFGIVTWLVRLYVRHMLQMAGISVEDFKQVPARQVQAAKLTTRKKIISAPMQAGILDLSTRLKESQTILDRLKTVLQFVINYKFFFAGVFLLIGFVAMIVIYVVNANTDYRAYEVQYINNEAATKVNSEEILYDRQKQASDPVIDNSLPKLAIVNRSGEPGVGAKIKLKLEGEGYEVVDLKADFTDQQEKTVIVSLPTLQAEALVVSQILNKALISTDNQLTDDLITIYLGSDVNQI